MSINDATPYEWDLAAHNARMESVVRAARAIEPEDVVEKIRGLGLTLNTALLGGHITLAEYTSAEAAGHDLDLPFA